MQKSQADAIVPGLLSAAGASRYLGFSPATIYQMIRDGELRSLLYRRRGASPRRNATAGSGRHWRRRTTVMAASVTPRKRKEWPPQLWAGARRSRYKR